MTQNTLELAAFDRVFLLDADDAQGVAPALEALGEEPDGFILFERYHDETNIETVLRTTGWSARSACSSISIRCTGCIKP